MQPRTAARPVAVPYKSVFAYRTVEAAISRPPV